MLQKPRILQITVMCRTQGRLLAEERRAKVRVRMNNVERQTESERDTACVKKAREAF